MVTFILFFLLAVSCAVGLWLQYCSQKDFEKHMALQKQFYETAISYMLGNSEIQCRIECLEMNFEVLRQANEKIESDLQSSFHTLKSV